MINGKNIIAICTSRIHDHQHHNFLEQINKYLLNYNCSVMIFTLNSDLYWVEDAKSPESYVFDIIPYDRIDCLILMDEKIKSRTVSQRIISKAKANSVPVIVVDGKYDDTVEIYFDYEKGFEGVVRHVIEDHSVKKPHFMAGLKGNKFSDARMEIFKKVIEENGIKFDYESMVSYGEFWSGPARTATEALIESGNIPDAVICANDIMALNVCDVFIKAGIKVPEQVIVTGFDGIDEALLSNPPLTTAGCDSIELAEAVGRSVVSILNGEKPHDTAVIPKLCPNTSCGCVYIPSNSDIKMNDFNNRFYRYQDDIRMLYDISTKIQMSTSPEQASSHLQHYILHDMCCVVDTECFENGKNYFVGTEIGEGRCLFYDSYYPEKCNIPLSSSDFVPDIEKRIGTDYPLIFNALDFMSKPFGYVCYSYSTYDINEYTRTSSITNTISMGLGGYISMHYQAYLTEKITAELKVAAQMQMSMLPTNFAKHDKYEISASMIPAKNVGGDFYDFFQIDADHLGLVIADVSGKGVPAALFMATSKLIIHDRALQPGTPAEILRDVNRHICENNKMGLFITMWFGILDLKTGVVTYANAGHEYPAVKLGDGKYEVIKSDNLPPIGADDDMEYQDMFIDLSGGGTLFLYTDGVTDVKNADGVHFGLDRTVDLLNTISGNLPKDIIKGVNGGVDDFSENMERFDDTTMMCISFKGI